ncbi:MAG: hypothetical protein JWM97_2722 [Phycisphaerales bacterium]|jgi:hypothetical protein|nr:hypothetical protein [Phycisphaerales bacterium]MDB5305173.1 hypothetical protein [Phycisphaerales bacterium]
MTEFATKAAERPVVRKILGAAVLAAAVAFTTTAKAADTDTGGQLRPFALSLDPTAGSATDQSAEKQTPFFLDEAAPAAEAPNIHGFASISFNTAYITPRGLVVVKNGVAIQPVGGLVLPIGDIGFLKNFTAVTGVWNNIATAQNDPAVGPWNEMDYFVSFSSNVLDKFSLTFTYSPWNFPQSTIFKPHTEHNIDLKIAYDDSDLWGKKFALNPYVDLWYEISGSSTVALGSNGNTGYFELGVVPTYTVKAIPDYPITLTFPTYFSVGPKDYWGRGGTGLGVDASSDGNFGVASIAINGSVPLSFIPSRYGHWHGDLGLKYEYLINSTLLRAGTALTGNTERSVFIGSAGFGVNF